MTAPLPSSMKKLSLITLAVLTLSLCGCAAQESGGSTSNPPSETPEQYRQRIQASSLSEEEKQRKLQELDRMKQMNEAFLKQGAPSSAPGGPPSAPPPSSR